MVRQSSSLQQDQDLSPLDKVGCTLSQGLYLRFGGVAILSFMYSFYLYTVYIQFYLFLISLTSIFYSES